MAMNKYFCFRKIMDLVTDEYEVSDATMNNWADEIEVIGKDSFGNTIKVRVEMKYEGGAENGN